ncbi:MAG: dTMP kinase [Phycisphaeraceae bacterium]|nr:dTMP kinase [Phycisphaeraceae bacterium]MCW5754802.1 dTMP kinase [Phycisphaeraceae bacterium]
MSSWVSGLAGRFIVFDGIDGSGKSTQLRRLVSACTEDGVRVCQVREPGGTTVGERIREILLDRTQEGMTLRCEMLLYMASRVQLVEEKIRPALDRRELVLADRFVSSTLAYQGSAGGISRDDILAVARVAIGPTWPDLVVIFDVDPASASRRTKGVERGKGRGVRPAGSSLFDDRIEQRGDAYQAKVRQGFLEQAAADPDRYLLIDGTAPEDDVWEALVKGLRARFARS